MKINSSEFILAQFTSLLLLENNSLAIKLGPLEKGQKK
jgi:hypothetical protein